MESPRTHIHHLTDDILVSIFWPSIQSKSYTSESDDSWIFRPFKPKYIYNACPEGSPWQRETPMPTPPASADAAHNLLVASICHCWRLLAQSHVATLLVKEDRVVSRQDVLTAVACFPNLTHLHLLDRSVEALDNTFLADLASSCPRLRALHIGELTLFAGRNRHARKAACLIDESCLDHLARHCPQLEHLSLYWLEKYAEPPASLFQLPLRTLVLNNQASILTAPKLSSLSSLTALSFDTTSLYHDQLSSLLQLTNLTRLSLPDIGVFSRHTPDFSLAQLPALHSLKLEVWHGQLSDFFRPGFLYTSLKRLQLTYCNDQECLPDSIGELLPSLQELSIIHCRSLSDLTDQFTSLSCLETLTISSCNVSSLPESFGNLSALKTLVLRELPLLCLPCSFTRLASLETFLLVECEGVGELPAAGLTNLQTLCVRRSNEEQLPPSFTQLPSLTSLEVDQCMFAELPEDIGEATRLQELYFRDSLAIRYFPECVTELISLRVLRIEGCSSLLSFPTRLDRLTRLKELELRGCWLLREAPQALPPSLQALSYRNNKQLVSLPSISSLTELKELCLGTVSATCFQAIGASLSGLEHLELVLGEGAEEFLSVLTRLPSLRTLKLNKARCLQNLLKSDGSCLKELRQLNIDIACDELTELPAALTTLHHLTSLQIHAPKLSSLPDAIGSLSRLRKLDISNCSSLTHLPDSSTQLSCLHELNASNTSIRLLPPGFTQLSRLMELDLSNCEQLEAVPDDISSLKMLEHFSVDGCDRLQH